MEERRKRRSVGCGGRRRGYPGKRPSTVTVGGFASCTLWWPAGESEACECYTLQPSLRASQLTINYTNDEVYSSLRYISTVISHLLLLFFISCPYVHALIRVVNHIPIVWRRISLPL